MQQPMKWDHVFSSEPVVGSPRPAVGLHVSLITMRLCSAMLLHHKFKSPTLWHGMGILLEFHCGSKLESLAHAQLLCDHHRLGQGWAGGSCLIVAPADPRVWEDPYLFSSNERSNFKVFGFFLFFCCLFCFMCYILSPIQNSIFKHYYVTKRKKYNFWVFKTFWYCNHMLSIFTFKPLFANAVSSQEKK